MSQNEVITGRTCSGKKRWMLTIGTTTYFRTEWKDIIAILNNEQHNMPVIDAGYGKNIYSGD